MLCNQCLKFSFTLICQEKVRENKFNYKFSEMDAIIKKFCGCRRKNRAEDRY